MNLELDNSMIGLTKEKMQVNSSQLHASESCNSTLFKVIPQYQWCSIRLHGTLKIQSIYIYIYRSTQFWSLHQYSYIYMLSVHISLEYILLIFPPPSFLPLESISFQDKHQHGPARCWQLTVIATQSGGKVPSLDKIRLKESRRSIP